MRKIESDMLAAIEAGKDWKSGNTAVTFHQCGMLWAGVVTLHGHTIATINNHGVHPVAETFRQHPTVTTRSRLRALGVNADAYIPRNLDKPRQAFIDGVAL